jgi:protein pelota
LLASPGFTAQNFQAYIKSYATSTPHKPLQALLPLITVTHSSSANLSALAEVLASPAVLAKLSDTKFARETQLLDAFYTSLRRDDGKAWYGPKEVEKCVEKGAVGRGGGVLLISNRLFRATDVGERKKWVALVDRVREQEGGEVRVLSEAHESGKRLETLGGVAAILTFPLFDLDEDDEDGNNGAGAKS